MNNIIRPSERDEKNIPGIGYVIGLIVLAAIVIIALTPITKIFASSQVLSRWVMFFSYTVTYSIVLLVSVKIWGIKKFDFKLITFTTLALLVPLVFSMLALSEFVVSFIPMPNKYAEMFEKLIKLDFPGFLTVCIAAPLLEEFIFRGVILKSFLKKFTTQKAIFWSAFLFGLFHLNPWQFFPALFIGLVIGWIYFETNSILPGLFIHFANNSISFLLALKYKDVNVGFKYLVGSNLNYFLFLLGALAILIFSIYFLRKHLKNIKTA